MKNKQLNELGIKIPENNDRAICECICHEGEFPMDCVGSCDGCAIPPEEYCKTSERVDGKKHSWRFDGDDPYVICSYCGQVKDAISGKRIK